MTSHDLVEGFLDVKDPRGSEDRKFWKAWRRQWVSFSIVHASRREEPYLILKLSNSPSSPPEKQIRIQRDGLHLFRCRSKSRPYRTWAIMSRNKLIRYFAAQTEIEAQNWMHEAREGLWPSCFSFQMLTACSHEVSLIDDENTFVAGHLGAYGRLVLTSDGIISLMHPHWGSTLLQISLTNVQDVLFVREAEIPPAGVFSIVLKGKDFKVKALQFFCTTAMDAVQWILSKIFDKNSQSNTMLKKTLSKKPSLVLCDITQENKMKENNEDQSVSTNRLEISKNNIIDSSTDYENLRYLKKNLDLDTGKCNPDNSLKVVKCALDRKETENFQTEQVSPKIMLTDELSNKSLEMTSDYQHFTNELFAFKLNEDNIYANINAKDAMNEELQQRILNNDNDISKDPNVKHTNLNKTSENFSIEDLSPSTTIENNSKSGLYSTVKKQESLGDSDQQRRNVQDVKNADKKESVPGEKSMMSEDTKLSISNKIKELSNHTITSASREISEHSLNDVRAKHEKAENAVADFSDKNNLPANPFSYYANNNKNMTVNEKKLKSEEVRINLGLKDESVHLLPNISSDFLNSSFNSSVVLKNKLGSEYSTPEEDIGILSWIEDDMNFNDQLYEDITERKGTIYEEIDTSSSDEECKLQQPPELPKRPESLEIPDSLRLHKLSKNIKQTLEVIESPVKPTKEYPRPKFIKKIKDVNRVMQISSNSESSSEPFKVLTKVPTGFRNVSTSAVRNQF